jgi:hypothetical protein
MPSRTTPSSTGNSAAVDAHLAAATDWRGDTLRRVRALIREVLPDVEEDIKWGNVPVWSHHGMLCTGESYKKVVKLTFAHGAALSDPSQLFNASLEGKTRRAIDIAEGVALDATAFQALIRAASDYNHTFLGGRSKTRAKAT